MEKSVRVFSSFREHDADNARAEMSTTPAERIQIVIELRDRWHPDAAEQRMERICRIIKLGES